MTKPPTFATKRLLIHPRSSSDLEDCLAMDRDPLVTQYIPGPWSDPVKHRAFVVERMATVYPAGMGYWTIRNRIGPEYFLGWVLLLPYHFAGDEVEIGWRLLRKYWGQGYATEAASIILKHAFQNVGLESVVADIDAQNNASKRVAEKLGMRFIEKRRIDGKEFNSYSHSKPILAND